VTEDHGRQSERKGHPELLLEHAWVVMAVVMAFVAGVIVTGVHVVTTVVVRPMVVSGGRQVVLTTGGAAVVTLLGLPDQVVLLIALALVGWAVALAARVVITAAHRRIVAVVLAVMLGRVAGVVLVLVRVGVFVAHLAPRLLLSSKIWLSSATALACCSGSCECIMCATWVPMWFSTMSLFNEPSDF
jgi:hypothetical protein